ncbi:MAG: UpxY family transcription antiterminator [Calditrichaeota bacterium]|nr:MAG: UpxY family transcription antiterminator [Calditrichota bacterium]
MPWYALYTRPRHEKKVYEGLSEKGITAFLPTVRQLRQWKDRRKWVEMPLFNSYVFVQIELKDKLRALQTKGVVRMVSFGGVPAAIPDWQIEQLRRVIEHPETLQPEQYLKEGDWVEIIEGPLKGVRGYLRQLRGETRVAILIDGIYQSASFVVDRRFVKKIRQPEEESR